jgi:hypothetical protein
LGLPDRSGDLELPFYVNPLSEIDVHHFFLEHVDRSVPQAAPGGAALRCSPGPRTSILLYLRKHPEQLLHLFGIFRGNIILLRDVIRQVE